MLVSDDIPFIGLPRFVEIIQLVSTILFLVEQGGKEVHSKMAFWKGRLILRNCRSTHRGRGIICRSIREEPITVAARFKA